MSGLAPLSYATVEAWARLHDVAIEPQEIEALMLLDAIRCHPDPDEEPKGPR